MSEQVNQPPDSDRRVEEIKLEVSATCARGLAAHDGHYSSKLARDWLKLTAELARLQNIGGNDIQEALTELRNGIKGFILGTAQENCLAALWLVTGELARLQRERDMWKSNHDNQVKLRRALMDRPDLGERAESIKALAAERDEAVHAREAGEREVKRLREALEQAKDVLDNGYGDRELVLGAYEKCVTALAPAQDAPADAGGSRE